MNAGFVAPAEEGYCEGCGRFAPGAVLCDGCEDERWAFAPAYKATTGAIATVTRGEHGWTVEVEHDGDTVLYLPALSGLAVAGLVRHEGWKEAA